MNHAGNSKAAEEEVHELDEREARTPEETVLYDGGRCSYDPYSLYGFGKFGDQDSTEAFNHGLWGQDAHVNEHGEGVVSDDH